MHRTLFDTVTAKDIQTLDAGASDALQDDVCCADAGRSDEHARQATVCLNADGPSGEDAYAPIRNVLGEEAIDCPDTVHKTKHIRKATDAVVGPHFVVSLHRDLDKSGLAMTQRCEFKAYQGSSAWLIAKQDETFIYRWRIKIPADMVVSTKSTYLFQLKSDGVDGAQPMIVINATKYGEVDKLQVKHGTRSEYATLQEVDLQAIRGQWVEVYLRAKMSKFGALVLRITKADGTVLMSIDKAGMDLWRNGTYVGPKWGMQRSLESSEQLRADAESVAYANVSITRGDLQSQACGLP